MTNPVPDDDDRGVTQEEMDAFYRDMDAMPPDLPSAAEVEEMARAAGADGPPF